MTWRELVVPQPIVAFIAEVWMDVNVDEFNDESGEVRAFAPGHSTHPLVLDRSRYRPLDASIFPGELRDIDHHRFDTESPSEGQKKPLTEAERHSVQLSDRDDAVLRVLAAHHGRLFHRSELAAAAWGACGADQVAQLEQTITRIQKALAASSDTVELTESGDRDPQYRLLVPHSGPGTESPP